VHSQGTEETAVCTLSP